MSETKESVCRERGWDSIFTKPGEFETMTCRACGSRMEVMRNEKGAASWAEMLAKKESIHDWFFCPHSNEDWHKQVLGLRHEVNRTNSRWLARSQ